MTALLVLTAALLALSGGLKIRASLRVGLGLPSLSVLELVLAAAVMMAGPIGVGELTVVRLLVPVSVLFLIASTIAFSLRLRDHRRQRSALEEKRLQAYVEYLYQADRAEEPGPES